MRGTPPPPEEIARAASNELSQPKYRLGAPWWTRLVDFLERAWVRFVEWVTAVSDHVGGPLVLAIIVAVVLITTVILVTANLGRRRARAIDERIRREREAVRGLDPDLLERQAAEAETAGDLARAFRLLFQAGLVRLDRAGVIDLRPGTTSGTVAEAVDSREFTELTERFDAVVYGHRPATPSDVQHARDLLSSLLVRRP
jgi:hypothetical protein